MVKILLVLSLFFASVTTADYSFYQIFQTKDYYYELADRPEFNQFKNELSGYVTITNENNFSWNQQKIYVVYSIPIQSTYSTNDYQSILRDLKSVVLSASRSYRLTTIKRIAFEKIYSGTGDYLRCILIV